MSTTKRMMDVLNAQGTREPRSLWRTKSANLISETTIMEARVEVAMAVVVEAVEICEEQLPGAVGVDLIAPFDDG